MPAGGPSALATKAAGLERPGTRPLSTRATQIVSLARHLLEEEGADALTMRRLAEELGIQAPSIYKHLPGKQAINAALIELALVEAGAAFHDAIQESEPGQEIANLLAVFRRFGRAQPNLYRLVTTGPLPREELTPGLEDWTGDPFFLATGDPDLARALWSFAHGMVILEIDDRYPADADLDKAWAAGVAAFTELADPDQKSRRRPDRRLARA
jgi:AcrR family transcriptional regulator